jgi:hypothetical protein
MEKGENYDCTSIYLSDLDMISKIPPNQHQFISFSDRHKIHCSRDGATNKHRVFIEQICIGEFMFW